MSTVLTRPAVRVWTVALRLLVLATAATVVYTAVVTGVGQLVFPAQANGSLLRSGGRVVGSALIGQSFTGAEWFQPRPSAAGKGYDAGASSGSNLGPDNPALVKAIAARRAAYLRANGSGPVPADALTVSGSGLDPDISVANALRQADRVAAARGLSPASVRTLVERHVSTAWFEQPGVNVLELNLALVHFVGDSAGHRPTDAPTQ